MTHPFYAEVTTESALALAHNIIYGPWPALQRATPSVDEAIAAINEARKRCGFNWITGAVSEEVLRLTRGETLTFRRADGSPYQIQPQTSP